MEKIELAPGVWNLIPNGHARAYLVVGAVGALLIDTGAGEVDVKAACDEVTSLPVTVVNTHNHRDHTADNDKFETVYMHPADIARLPEPGRLLPVEEGAVFDLGGRSLRVLETPGHTPGSISLYEPEANLIFTGDFVSKTPIYLIRGDYDLDAFSESLKKLLPYEAKMYGAHDPTVNGRETLEKLLETIELFRAGKLEPKPMDGPMKASVYIAPNGTGFLCPDWGK